MTSPDRIELIDLDDDEAADAAVNDAWAALRRDGVKLEESDAEIEELRDASTGPTTGE